jgi:ubiquinone/menaquinone biosynthesis C-methylase UbiE
MSGVKMGDRLLIVGCSDAKVVAQLALKPGISGRACVVDADGKVSAHAAAVAMQEGALVEAETAPLTMLPYDDDAFDVAVLNHVLGATPSERRVQLINEARRVLRTGGRCVAIEAVARGGLAALVGSGARLAAKDLEEAFRIAGLRAVRTLAERDGVAYVEGANR